MLSDIARNMISRNFTKQNEIKLENHAPSFDNLARKLEDIDELGIYLHIPFCNRICPYCPYNRELFSPEACKGYKEAVIHEIDRYRPILARKRVTSFYIGGGTPTIMLGRGIEEIIGHIYKHLNMQCHVHMESHPNHLTSNNLDAIEAMGVRYLSIGVEALQDHHLRNIERPYTVREVKESVGRAVERGFDCVNIDFMFDLPGQTAEEVEQAGHEILNMGVDQVATYPLFRFPYTPMGHRENHRGNAVMTMFRRRKLLKILEDTFYSSSFERSSVWAFTRKGVDKYCSVTVPLYLGLGASGGTYLKDIFYINTFNVSEYIKAISKDKMPVALSIDLTEEMQMAGWLYWRFYETRFRKSDFTARFGSDFDQKYGKQIKMLSRLGYLKNGQDQVSLTSKGAYWIHAFEDFFSINYINKLWATAKFEPWPEKVVL